MFGNLIWILRACSSWIHERWHSWLRNIELFVTNCQYCFKAKCFPVWMWAWWTFKEKWATKSVEIQDCQKENVSTRTSFRSRAVSNCCYLMTFVYFNMNVGKIYCIQMFLIPRDASHLNWTLVFHRMPTLGLIYVAFFQIQMPFFRANWLALLSGEWASEDIRKIFR